MSNLQGWTLARKLMVVGILLAIPILFLLLALVQQQNVEIAFARKEVQGNRYSRPLRKVQEQLLAYAVAVQRRAGGNSGVELSGYAAAVDSALNELDGVDKELGSVLSQADTNRLTANFIKDLRDNWQNLRVATGANATRKAIDQSLRSLNTLITHVGDASNLILDPDLDSFYVMNAVVAQLPALQERVGMALELATSQLGKEKIPEDRRLTLNLHTTLARQLTESVDSDLAGLRVAFRNDSTSGKTMTNALTPLLANFKTDQEALLSLIQKRVLTTDAIATATEEEVSDAGS